MRKPHNSLLSKLLDIFADNFPNIFHKMKFAEEIATEVFPAAKKLLQKISLLKLKEISWENFIPMEEDLDAEFL
jgi:hypothetical protein